MFSPKFGAIICGLFLWFPTHSFALQNDNVIPQKVSLAEAWQIVVQDNDALEAARANVERTQHTKDGTKDLYLPNITLSAGYMYLDDDVTLSPQDLLDSMPAGNALGQVLGGLAMSQGISPAQLNSGLTSTIAERNNISSSIRASWPVYTGGRITAAQDIATGKVHEANHSLALKVEDRFETLVRYYFGTVLAKIVFVTRQEVEAGLKKHRDHAALLEQQGQIAKVERMQSEASHDKASVERRKAGRDLEIAQVALSRMLKMDGLVLPTDPLFLGKSLPPLASFIEKALSTFPGLAILASKKEQAEGLINLEKGRYHPTVAVFGNYSLYEEDNLATKLVPDWAVGVGISIPLLERSGRSGKLQAAKTMVREIDYLTAQARSDLSVLIEKTYRQAEQSFEEYQGLESSLKLAEETVKLRIKAFSQGISTSLDVVDAELFLASVKTQRAFAVYNYVVALAKLMAISNDLENFFIYQHTPNIEVR
jgi:outer membrane protein TolC